jgi:hypothetical protein
VDESSIDVVGERLTLLVLEIGNDHLGASSCQPAYGGGAQAGGTSSDDRSHPCQFHVSSYHVVIDADVAATILPAMPGLPRR